MKQAAERLDIRTILQPDSVKDPAFASTIDALYCDLHVGGCLPYSPRTVFMSARLGAFNLHASLLPKFRGAAPINRALMAGATQTGVTTFFLKEKVDTGNIILQWPTAILPHETAGDLHDRLARLGARAVLETTRRITGGRAKTYQQDDVQATPAPKVFRSDCRIPWEQPAEAVHNHCRDLPPTPVPGLLEFHYTENPGNQGNPRNRRTRHGPESERQPSNSVQNRGDCVARLQAPGQRVLEVRDFLNGYPISPGTTLT